jgi:uncharacterized protein YukE
VSFRIEVDAASVLGAAAAVRRLGSAPEAAPGGAALRRVAAAAPGGELARAASEEAAEWESEMRSLVALLDRCSALLEEAAAGYRRVDAAVAAPPG